MSMRQIKFRAKTINEGEWVYSMTISHGTVDRKRNCLFFEVQEDKWKGVIPETLGQFTGLADCNGKEIYEGDIVSVVSEGDRRKCEVAWSEGTVGFFLRHPAGVWYLSGAWGKEAAEVIGNIHDNPELIKR